VFSAIVIVFCGLIRHARTFLTLFWGLKKATYL